MRALLILFLFSFGAGEVCTQDTGFLIDTYASDNFDQLFAANVKVEIDRKKTNHTAKKGAQVISEKLKSFNPVRWESIHKGSAEGDGDDYSVYEVYNSTGKGMRIFVHLVQVGSKDKIASVRFRKVL